MDKIVFLPVIYEGSRDLKDRTKKLVFNTQEITPEQAAQLQLMVQQFGYLALKKEDFSKEEISAMENLKCEFDDSTKPPSKRMRSVLYRLWQQNNEGFKTSEQHYNHHMEIIINHLKNKLV